MRSFRSKPVGWRYDSVRHSLAARGLSSRGYFVRSLGSADVRSLRDELRLTNSRIKDIDVAQEELDRVVSDEQLRRAVERGEPLSVDESSRAVRTMDDLSELKRIFEAERDALEKEIAGKKYIDGGDE